MPNPLAPHMQTLFALQSATKEAREATGVLIGTAVKGGMFQVGIATDLPNGESTWDPLSGFQPLPATLDTLRRIASGSKI